MVHVATSYTNTCVQQSNVNTITQHAHVASCVRCNWYLVMIIAYDWPFAGLAWDTRGWWKFYILSFKNTKKWNESGFRPPLCTYRLNWARRTSWGWWDDWDDTVLQTQDSKFEPWRSEAEHATSRSRRLPTILTFTRGWGRNNFVSFKPPRPGTEPRTLAWKAAVLTTTLGPPPFKNTTLRKNFKRYVYCKSAP